MFPHVEQTILEIRFYRYLVGQFIGYRRLRFGQPQHLDHCPIRNPSIGRLTNISGYQYCHSDHCPIQHPRSYLYGYPGAAYRNAFTQHDT